MIGTDPHRNPLLHPVVAVVLVVAERRSAVAALAIVVAVAVALSLSDHTNLARLVRRAKETFALARMADCDPINAIA